MEDYNSEIAAIRHELMLINERIESAKLKKAELIEKKRKAQSKNDDLNVSRISSATAQPSNMSKEKTVVCKPSKYLITNLDPRMEEQEVKDHFKKFGKIKSFEWVEKGINRSKLSREEKLARAFIEFDFENKSVLGDTHYLRNIKLSLYMDSENIYNETLQALTDFENEFDDLCFDSPNSTSTKF